MYIKTMLLSLLTLYQKCFQNAEIEHTPQAKTG